MDLDALYQRKGIGTLAENSLHASLIEYYAQPGDLLEAKVGGSIIDILRGDLLIEIQTRHFSAIKRKLTRLLEHHPVRLVYPIVHTKWIIRQKPGEQESARRKSPLRGRIEHLFNELIRIPGLIQYPGFSIELLMIQEEELQLEDGRGSWRRQGRSIADRRLLGVLDRHLFSAPEDFGRLLPTDLPRPFTNVQLATRLDLSPALARKMTYCLRQMNILNVQGKLGNSYLYSEEQS